MLLKLIDGDILYVLGGFRTYPGLRSQLPGAEPGRIARYSVIVNNISNSIDEMPVIPREPSSGILRRLRNLYPRSTQNTNGVSPINFSNFGVSCLIILYFYSINIHVI